MAITHIQVLFFFREFSADKNSVANLAIGNGLVI